MNQIVQRCERTNLPSHLGIPTLKVLENAYVDDLVVAEDRVELVVVDFGCHGRHWSGAVVVLGRWYSLKRG